MGVNSVVWSRDLIIAIKKYEQGNQAAEFVGTRKNGQKYKTGMPVAAFKRKHPSWVFAVKGSKLMVNDKSEYGAREVLSPEATERLVKSLYKNKAIAVGKAPSIFNYMKTKYVGFGYARVEKIMKTIPSYQLYQARHLKKNKSRTIIISRAPGAEIDCDLMFFSKKYYTPSMNDNMQGLLVIVDRFSGYLAVAGIRFGALGRSMEVVARKAERLLRSDAFPKAAGRTIFHDNGPEFRSVFQTRMAQLGYNDVVISQAAGAPSPHAERAVGIIRKLVNQKLSANAAPKAGTQRWWPLARQLVQSYNDTPMTDARAPHTPNQLKGYRGQRALKMVRLMQRKGMKRLGLAARTRKTPDGALVPKNLKILRVGDKVRVALEHLSKDAGGPGQGRKFPKQRWSSTTYAIAKVLARKVGVARYQLSRLPRQRFEREDLQLVGRRKPGSAAQPEAGGGIEPAVAKLAAKRTDRYA